MPRLPVDGKKVVEHRITLGAKERELVQDAQWSYTFGKIGQTFSTVMGNPVILLGISAWIAYKLDELLDPNWREIIAELTPAEARDWLETQNLVGATFGGIIGLFLGGPFGAVFGSILGSATVEVGEWAYEGLDEASDEMFEGIDETLSKRNAVNVVLWFMAVERTLRDLGESLQGGSDDSQGSGGGGAF